MTKYGFEIEKETIKFNTKRLTNQLWKLIPMREHEENWVSQLETVLIELTGLNEILRFDNNFLILLSKLEGIKLTDPEFFVYRKTVFECISLLGELMHEN